VLELEHLAHSHVKDHVQKNVLSVFAEACIAIDVGAGTLCHINVVLKQSCLFRPSDGVSYLGDRPADNEVTWRRLAIMAHAHAENPLSVKICHHTLALFTGELPFLIDVVNQLALK
jgi:hypothetical protein